VETSVVRRVLVVDDNRDTADSLAVLLRLAGHEAWAVYEGRSVLGAARALRPDVVLLDLALPGGPSGYELAQRLRHEPGFERALLVAVSGYGQEEDRQHALQVGFDHHLLKPAEPDELMSLISRPR
jgi:CheY-like chemotaxis protein